MIETGHASHIGLRRELNEDTYWVDTGLGLFVVVDGMGGAGRGDAAAAIARDVLVDAARTGRDLATAIRDAGSAIAALSPGLPDMPPPGATLAILKIEGNRYTAVWIGDARIYLWQHGMLMRLGVDTTIGDAGAPAAAGTPPPTPPPRNRATHALGITPPAEFGAEPVHGTLERGMQFLLCTDGLCEELDDRRIKAMLARSDIAAQECVDHLLLGALDAGGRDNVTLVLVRAT